MPYAKGEGSSLMAVDFFFTDYGWLKSPDGLEEARVLFRAGKSRDGYFTSKDILEQAARAIDILKKHYPHEKHVFVYDNATTHTRRPPDALSARKLTVKPSNFLSTSKVDGVVMKCSMRDGKFLDGTNQSFILDPMIHEAVKVCSKE